MSYGGGRMKIGYIRGKEGSKSYKSQLKFLESSTVDKIYREKSSGNIELFKMLDYTRSGDIIFIYSIEVMGKNVKAAIRFFIQASEKNTTIIIKKEKIDTSSQIGKHILEILVAFDAMSEQAGLMERSEAPSEKGRIPRELADLRAYVKLVKKHDITVAEVCRKLNIGRTTYYRRSKELDQVVESEESDDDTNEVI